MKRNQINKENHEERQKEVYETPTLSYHGERQALTLQYSIPIAIVGPEGVVDYSR